MFFCEMCGSGDCCERTDIHGGPILCDTCYMEAKQDQEDKDAIEEIFKDNQDIGGEGSGIKISQRRPSKGYHLQIRDRIIQRTMVFEIEKLNGVLATEEQMVEILGNENMELD